MARMHLSLSLVLVLGCAASAPGPAPAPGPGAPETPLFLPEAAGFAARWAGHYEGSGKVFHHREGQWVAQVQIRLDIQPLLGQRLGVSGYAAADSFFFLAVPTDSLKLEGEARQATAKYSYSLSRTAEGIAGSVAAHFQEEQVGPFFPGDEWVFEVSRKPEP